MAEHTRRGFLKTASAGVAAVGVPAVIVHGDDKKSKVIEARDYLKRILYTRKDVDDWLAGRDFVFAKYDSGLGWLLKNAKFVEGIDGSTCIYHYERQGEGERKMIAHAEKPCRVNTYGDSFTMCHQVNDGETWQEILASHFCEPVKNFGVGAWSVYQAYRRMLREEARTPADVIILNIYDDDHYRNLDAWRQIRAGRDVRFLCPTCPHLKVNIADEKVEEMDNPCPTPESVYNLCDLDWVVDRFKDDFVLGIMLAHANAKAGNPDRAYKAIMDLATTHGINTKIDRGERLSHDAMVLHARAALMATTQIVDWVERFAKESGKKVLYVLSFNATTIAKRLREGTRFDQDFVANLHQKKLPVVDLMEEHVADFKQHSLSVDDYLRRYYIGHYNPHGNFFTAMAIRRNLLDLLDPRPVTYPKAS